MNSALGTLLPLAMDYIRGWQWIAIVALIVLIIVWVMMRRRG